MFTIENEIRVAAPPLTAETYLLDPEKLHRWINPLFRFEPVGESGTTAGSRFRFVLQIPPIHPALEYEIAEHSFDPTPDAPTVCTVVYRFTGFMEGRDTWTFTAEGDGTRVWNRFEYDVPNPLVRLGWQILAEPFTVRDMREQMERLRRTISGD